MTKIGRCLAGDAAQALELGDLIVLKAKANALGPAAPIRIVGIEESTEEDLRSARLLRIAAGDREWQRGGVVAARAQLRFELACGESPAFREWEVARVDARRKEPRGPNGSPRAKLVHAPCEDCEAAADRKQSDQEEKNGVMALAVPWRNA
jgi:hypothetical protein